MSLLRTSDLEQLTGFSQRYWQKRIANGEVPGATQIDCGANRRFLIEREAFTTWWNGKPMYVRDVKQLCDALGNPKLPEQGKGEHHALADARWTHLAWRSLVATM